MSQPGYLITRVVTPAAEMTLVTLDQAKAVLGIDPSDTSHDATLQAQIASVSSAVQNYCDRIFPVQTYRDQYRGVCLDYQKPIRCRQYPVQVDDSANPMLAVTLEGNTVTPDGYDLDLETGALYMIDGSWYGVVVLDYTAGYDPIPDDLQSATLEWLAARWWTIGRDPTIRSETVPDLLSQTFGMADLTAETAVPPGVRDLLWPYIHFAA